MGIFIGHTRFSLYMPKSKAWVASSRQNPESYLEGLFKSERMEPRCEVFFNLSLPQLDKASQGHFFRHIVSFSPELPEKYKVMLNNAASQYKWLVLDEQIDRNASITSHQIVSQSFGISEIPDDGELVFATFRLDDDDVLPLSYFDRMSAYLVPALVESYVSFGRGITALQLGKGFSFPREIRERMFTAGLLSVCSISNKTGIRRPASYRSHSSADESAPVIVDSRKVGFFWNRNTGQDTALAHKTEQDSSTAIQSLLSKLNKIENLQILEDEFPCLLNKVDVEQLLYECGSNADGIEILHEISKPTCEIQVSISMTNGENVRTNNALIAFKVISGNGSDVSTQDIRMLAKFGIHPLAGSTKEFFKYIPTSAGVTTDQKISITLPRTYNITHAGVKYWGPKEHLNIEHLKISFWAKSESTQISACH